MPSRIDVLGPSFAVTGLSRTQIQNKRNQTTGVALQRGAALLIMLLVLFTIGMAVLLKGMGSQNPGLRQDVATTRALAKAKEALISYAVMYGDNYPPATGAGPGHLPCPDMDNNGTPNPPCGANAIGRLPRSIPLPSGSPFPLSDHNAPIDQQFWYALTDAYRNRPFGVVNSATPGTLTLDGQPDIVAVIIAPGSALGGQQNRPSLAAAEYLEAGNTTGPTFVTNAGGEFNDRVLAVRRDELMPPVTARIAEEIKKHLDAYHPTNGNAYPADQAEFETMLSTAPPWFNSNNWLAVTTYARTTVDSADLTFNSCGITYTSTFGTPGIDRSQHQC